MATGGLHDQSGRKEAHAYESGRIAIDDLGLSISFRIIDRNSPKKIPVMSLEHQKSFKE